MRILVVDHNRTERDATLRSFTPGTHDIVSVAGVHGAIASLDQRDADIVLVESTLPNKGAQELVRVIRSRESNRHTYILVTAARCVPGDPRIAYQTGADDFIRKPLDRDEVTARCDGPSRIMRWASRLIPLSGLEERERNADLTVTSAWASVDNYVCLELGEMLGMTFVAAEQEAAIVEASSLAMLPLSLATEGIEVCVAVGVDVESSVRLAVAVLESDSVDAEALSDMLREIANVSAGAFKRMAAVEGRAFTTGVPKAYGAHAFHAAKARARRQWLAICESPRVSLRFEVQLRTRETRHLSPKALMEGMVLTTDLLSDAGVLLIRGGTRITESHVVVLQRSLGERRLVEVAEAAE